MIGSKTRLGGMEQPMGGQKAIKESCTCFSNNFDMTGKIEIGL